MRLHQCIEFAGVTSIASKSCLMVPRRASMVGSECGSLRMWAEEYQAGRLPQAGLRNRAQAEDAHHLNACGPPFVPERGHCERRAATNR